MTSEERPSPDELLARLREEEAQSGRGRLTVFLGAAPGVGKTYAMIEAARAACEEGRDVVVGLAETHGRYETASLLLGLETLPRKKIPYGGVTLQELDIDLALSRHPSLIVVDELAHTNAPGMRNAKRWQDVEELLQAGIDVYTTLNIQHLESLNDVVAQITGIIVREKVPDSILRLTDEVKLIDLPPDDLLERLREGKVYVPEQAKRAMVNFFRKGNLIALRELSLRRVAERVELQMQHYRELSGIEEVWPVSERVMVCVGGKPLSARVVRAAGRMAASLRADFIAVHVESPTVEPPSPRARDLLAKSLDLAKALGGEVVVLRSSEPAQAVLRYARERNVTKIVMGKTSRSRFSRLFWGSFLDDVVRLSGDIDVHVISGDERDEG